MNEMDYATHPWFNPKQSLADDYGASIQRLETAFRKDDEVDKDAVLAEALAMQERYTPAGCIEQFGLGSGYSLAKEFYCDIIAANAGAAARVLEERGNVEAARRGLLDLYADCAAQGFGRASEFICNRIDSRTFMPMRRHIDRGYLEAIGYGRPEHAMICAGDCQTILLSEKIRDTLSLAGLDIAAYQHGLGSLVDSPLGSLFRAEAYFYFCNAAADYALFGMWPGKREHVLGEMQKIVDWLHEQRPRVSLFVTHVFFGIDAAISGINTPVDAALDSATEFSDEVAAILAKAPNAALINFQEICPLTRDNSPFRDDSETPVQLHFHFDIMDRVFARVQEALKDAGLE